MQFAREPYSPELVSEMVPLWRRHYDQIAGECYGPLDPDLAVYVNADQAGILRIFTARVLRSLVGYQVFFVNRHPHSRESIQAVQDILFMDRSARRGLTGYKFIRWCGEQLKAEGVQTMFQHISHQHSFGRMLERLGYKHIDEVWGKVL